MSKRYPKPRAWTVAALLCLTGIGLSACDDFLATEPKGELTTGNFFQTEAQAIQATNATYSMLRQWPVHVFAWLGMTDMASDDATKGSTPNDAGFLSDFENLSWQSGNGAFLDTWTGNYQGIYRANIALEGIPPITMDETLKQRLIGENKFLRAYFYFFLVRAYGGVPLLTAPVAPSEAELPRASADDVWALIEQDLTDAIAVLPPSYGAADIGRVTSGAAHALLAEVHLFQDEYEEAYQHATQLAGYDLFGDYATLFTRAGENSVESVFEVQSVALEEGGAGSQYQQVQGVRGTPNIGWGFNTPSDNLEAAFEPGDPRQQATILYPWEMIPDGSGRVVYFNAQMQNNQYNQKVFISPETPGGSGNGGVNIRRIRYAHVLLNAAEAAYRTSREGEAQTLLNEVRARARGDREVTLGLQPEPLAESISEGVLGLAAGESEVFVRYVTAGSAADAAGVQEFAFECANAACTGDVPPVLVTNMDIIRSVGGISVTTLDEYFDAVDAQTPGTPVAVEVLRVSQDAGGAVSTQALTLTVTAQALLPDVTATGQALLDAIWHERRVELGMEQHRWFDIVRQGRAAAVMAADGKTFITGTHELYPIPLQEITLTGLQQNPGYGN
ncbi:MAG: RagB/SusD family nutrient uptake outer membrane protein [Longimicrobiales bacterium]